MSSRPKPKFLPGDKVLLLDEPEPREVDRSHFDPSDGWEHHLFGDALTLFHFEADLTPVKSSVRLITLATWTENRKSFSEPEKQELRDAIVGEAVCPRGLFTDLAKLSARTRAKAEQLLLGRKK